MKQETVEVEIECKTKGFEKAAEQIETLVEAYDGFPPQVQIKGCHDCTIYIYPSQTKIYESEDAVVCNKCMDNADCMQD